MTSCFVWFLLDRPSPSSWNKIINYVQAPDSTISLYRNISGFTGEPFRKIGWKVFQNFVRAPQRKMHKSANPNLKNPAANSNPKMIRWCTFFFGQKLQISHLVHTCCHTNAQVSYRMAFPRFVWLFLGACRVSLSSETGIQYNVLSFYIEARGQNAWNHSKNLYIFLKNGSTGSAGNLTGFGKLSIRMLLFVYVFTAVRHATN